MADAGVDAGPCCYGVIKSYNERRGFGFVACEETAASYGRDVYLSKEEVSQMNDKLSKDASASAAPDASAALKEGDFVSFQVQKSTEGYPQAVCARRLRRLRGAVLHGTLPRDGGEGKIVVKGDGREGAEASTGPDPELRRLMGAEVRVRQADCGQLRLVPGDEVVFSCQTARDEVPEGASPVLEAQLVELLWTPRTSGSGASAILGCFTLELPRTAEPTAEGEQPLHLGAPAMLDGHALVDRVVLSGLPGDLDVPELMRLFSKLGATDAIVTDTEDESASSLRFASVTFPGPIDVARMLVRAAHTINAQGTTHLARLLSHRDGVIALPPLPAPTLSVADGSALLVQWQQVGLAAGYLVELRPKGTNAPWASVGVASGHLEDSDNLPAGLLGPQCAACNVSSISADTLYEARVIYYSSWGCRSQASASSVPCSLPGSSSDSATVGTYDQMPSAVAVPSPTANESMAPLLPMSLLSTGGAETEAQYASMMQAGLLGSMPMASLQPDLSGPMLTMPSSSQLPVNASAATALPAAAPGWRFPNGTILPPPAAPELIPYEEASRSVCIQWPTVVHATAYTVELLEEGTTTPERFTRAVPEILPEALVELRVGNLNPGAYAACVRCVAPCGSESAPSAWSFLPPLWVPPAPSLGMGWQPGLPVQAPLSGLQPIEPTLAGLQGGSAALLSTSPSAQTSTSQPPPPPSAPPSWPASSQPVGSPGSPAPAAGSVEDEALVLD